MDDNYIYRSPEDLIAHLERLKYPRADLPNDRGDPSWYRLEQKPYKLTLPEVVRLKNHLFPSDPPATTSGMCDRIVLCDVIRID